MQKYINLIFKYIQHILSVILIFVIIRFCEYFYILHNVNNLDINILFGCSINFDTLFVLAYSYVLFFFFSIVYFIRKSLAFNFIKAISFIVVLFNLVLTHFFLTTNALLTNEVLAISFQDILITILSEFSFNKLLLWFFDVFIILLAIFVLIKKKQTKYFIVSKSVKILVISLYVISSIIVIKNINHFSKSIKYFDNQYQFFAGNSKMTMFVQNYFNHQKLQSEINFIEYESSIKYWQKNNEFAYYSNTYPFVHYNNYPNVLKRIFYQ